jgi:hypothetical protein
MHNYANTDDCSVEYAVLPDADQLAEAKREAAELEARAFDSAWGTWRNVVRGVLAFAGLVVLVVGGVYLERATGIDWILVAALFVAASGVIFLLVLGVTLAAIRLDLAWYRWRERDRQRQADRAMALPWER